MAALLGWVLSAVNVINIIIFLAIFMLLCADMLLRYIGHSSLSGASEIVTVLVVYLYTLGLAEVYRSGHDIAMMFVVERLPPRLRAAQRVLATALTLAVMLGFAYCAYLKAQTGMTSQTPYLHWPLAIYYIPLILSGALTSLAILVNTVGKYCGRRFGSTPNSVQVQ
ncbi:MAG: TRAP transporter small permease [Janthinobacterium lividum]